MMRHLRAATLIALSLAVAACSTDAPGVTGTDAPATASSSLSATELLRLEASARRERERTALEARASERLTDSLRVSRSLLGGLVGTVTGTVTNTLSSPLLLCDPLQYASDVKIIGPAGGELRIGPHRLVIPAGALDRHTVITGEVPALALTPSVKLSPHGLRFQRAASLTLNYRHCLVQLGSQHSVVYTDDDATILEWLKSQDSSSQVVTGFIWHFSRYAVARSNYAVSW